MAELAETNVAGAEKRRSTRVIHSAAIIVKGTDALGREFRESTKTVIVNCYGCQYQSTNYPATNSAVMLEIRHADLRRPPRVVPARVIWVQRPKAYRALYHVGIEFEVAGNVWDMALPPEDWFPCPEDEELVVPVAAEENGTQAGHFIVAETSSPRNGNFDDARGAHAGTAAADADELTQTLLLADEISAVARQESVAIPAESADAIRELVKISAAEAVADEIAQMRQRIDAQLQESIDRAVNTLIERVAQSPALQRLHGQNGATRSNSIEGSASPNGNGDGAVADVSGPQDSALVEQSVSPRKRGKRNRRGPEPTA